MGVSARTTRLVRVPDLATFRRAAVDLACDGPPFDARDRLVIVPTHAAGAYLRRAIERRRVGPGDALVLPHVITRVELHARLAERLPEHPSPLTDAEREVLMGIACRRAVDAGADPPFRLRPALVAEIVELYDTLHRNLRQVDTFARLALGMLEPGAADDRGAERLVVQTRFLVSAFEHFERLRSETGAADEHLLRAALLAHAADRPWRHVVLSVADRACDPHGLFAADWDLLSRLAGLERIDIVATDATVAGAFHQRIHQLLPGIEEVRLPVDGDRPAPVLLVPAGGVLVHTARDREEEVAGFARRIRRERRTPQQLDDTALVVRRPLPYVYVAREVLRSAGIPSQMFDALPLAAEPLAAALDVILTCVSSNFGRESAMALLRSPHFRFGSDGHVPAPRAVAALDRALSEAGYLGDLDALERLLAVWEDSSSGPARPVRRAAAVLLATVRESLPLRQPAACSEHLDRLLAFIRRHEQLPAASDPLRARLLRGRAAILDVLTSLRDAYARFDTAAMEFDVLAASIRRWIEVRTFTPHTGEGGVHLVDAQSARFGDFEHVQLAGLIEGEWPEPPRRNIFYPPGLLRELGWPSESERLDAVRAAFMDLLRLPSSQLIVSTFMLEDEGIVAASGLLDALPAAALDTVQETEASIRMFDYEALAFDPVEAGHLSLAAQRAAERRVASRSRPASNGATTGHQMAAYSVSSLERYHDCPFKYFAADVLRLEEPPEEEPMRSPRARGRFVHEVFQRFFEAWDARGDGTITVDRIDAARALFEEVAAPMLARLGDIDAPLERARLFGSAVAPGIVDLVLGLEASRPTAVKARWLEYRLEGEFSLGASDGRRVRLKGVADRVDLLEGDRLRVIDYKSGYPPLPKRALQAPIYALCAQERLTERDGRAWQVDEAAYVAFSGKRALVPIVPAGGSGADAVLSHARLRLLDAVDAIEQGQFPPRPYELRLCTYCAYPSVCRKDYVGDD